jgi:hypothetical protein
MTTKSARWFSLLLLLGGEPLSAASAVSCGVLCGEWQLDTAASDSPAQVLDAAFINFKDPKARHVTRPPPAAGDEAMVASMDAESLGPTFKRLPRDGLREELQNMMRQPSQLRLAASGPDIRISSNTGPGDRLTPGEPHARVDRYGTARISTAWKGSRLVVTEKYDRANRQETTFGLRKADAALEVVQVITRSGLPRVAFRTVYRRIPSAGLESAQ